MSKVISFSISDKYLEKLRSLYPHLTDNLAAKQFLTDRLESSLSSSLDSSLDGDLDDKLKTLIETSLDDVLDERLDATVGKLIASLSERLTRLEARLDTNLDGGLDDMGPLLKLQREASIDGTVETVNTSPLPNQENVETDSTVEPDKGSIGPVGGDSDSIDTGKGEAVTIGDKPWYTIDDLLDCHYPGWPETKEGLRKKAKREHWPKRTRRGSKGNPYEYQAVLPG